MHKYWHTAATVKLISARKKTRNKKTENTQKKHAVQLLRLEKNRICSVTLLCSDEIMRDRSHCSMTAPPLLQTTAAFKAAFQH